MNKEAYELLDIALDNNGVFFLRDRKIELDKDGVFVIRDNEKPKELCKSLVSSILRGVEEKTGCEGWTKLKEKSIEIAWKNGRTYIFKAYSGCKYGGSEAYYEDGLALICASTNELYPLYEEGYYLR